MDCRLRLSDRVTNKPAPRKLSITMGIELGDVNGDGGSALATSAFWPVCMGVSSRLILLVSSNQLVIQKVM